MRPSKRRVLTGMVSTALITVVLVAAPSGPETVASASAPCEVSSNEETYRFLSVPGDFASKNSQIELRLGIKNTASVARTWSVKFYVDDIDPVLDINETPISVTIPANSRGVAKVMWDPIFFTGEHDLLYSATVGGVTTTNESDPWPIKILDITTKAPRYIGAAWVEPGQLMQDPNISQNAAAGTAYVEARVDEMHALGIDTIIIAYSEFKGGGVDQGPFYNSSLGYLNATDPDDRPAFDVVGTILHRACVNDMHVFVGLGRGLDPWLNLDSFPGPSQAEMDDRADFMLELANDLYNKYGVNDYYGANKGTFYGWYNTYEANAYNNAQYFYDQVAERLHNQFGHEKPVLIAPAGTPIGINATVLNSSESDIFAYQDAVGPGYIGPDASCLPACTGPNGTYTEGYKYTYNPYNRINDLSSIFSTYAGWHVGTDKHIWSDSELWEMDGSSTAPNNYGDPYAAQCQRFRDQIEPESNYVSLITGYDFFGPMKSPANTNTSIPYANSSQMYNGYKTYYDAGQPNMTGTPRLCT